jgi:predicted alpha/beta-fold hydrolase
MEPADDAFRPRSGFRGRHVQTLASFLLARHFNLPAAEERLIEVEPGVELLCHCHWQPDRAAPLTIIIVHGLEGSCDSGYMRGIAEKGLAAGMNVIRVNQRNCGGTNHLSPTLYNSSRSHDLAAVAQHLMACDRIARFALVGFSMGGNLVLKLAGEWGCTAPLQCRAVVAVCPSLDLAASADAMHEKQNFLYEKYFMRKLRKRFREKARLFPARFDISRLRGVRTLREFDHSITAYYCGFESATDYYARAAASKVIDRITIPTFILHAANDPFIRILPESREKIRSNPNITFLESADGGHCSFLADANGYDGFWAERKIIEFLKNY